MDQKRFRTLDSCRACGLTDSTHLLSACNWQNGHWQHTLEKFKMLASFWSCCYTHNGIKCRQLNFGLLLLNRLGICRFRGTNIQTRRSSRSRSSRSSSKKCRNCIATTSTPCGVTRYICSSKNSYFFLFQQIFLAKILDKFATGYYRSPATERIDKLYTT